MTRKISLWTASLLVLALFLGAAAQAQDQYRLVAGPMEDGFYADKAVIAFSPSADSTATLTWGAAGGRLDHTVTINGAPVARNDFGAPVYRTEITNLSPDKVYSYDLKIQETGGAGTAGYTGGSFRTAPVAARSFAFAVWGDNGSKEPNYAAKSGWPAVSKAMAADAAVELVATVGDLVGWNSPTNGDTEWETRFTLPARDLLAHKPMLFAQGNHDGHSGSKPVADPYAVGLFNLTAPSPNSYYSTWTYGAARIVMLDTEALSAGGAQTVWLEQTLRSAKEAYIFVLAHATGFSSGPHGVVNAEGVPYENRVKQYLQGVVPLLEKYGATAAFAGHDHFYERSEKGGVTYVIYGGGGDSMGDASNKDYSNHTSGRDPQNPYRKFFKVKTFGYTRVEVGADKATIKGVDTSGNVFDSIDLKPRK